VYNMDNLSLIYLINKQVGIKGMAKGDEDTLTGQKQILHHGFLFNIGKQILRFRWYLIFGFGIFILLFEGFELFEHPDAPAFSDPHIRVELLLYLLVILSVALLSEVYVRLLKMHTQALDVLKLKHALSRDFTRTSDWAEMCEQVCRRLGEFGPFDEILLFTYETESSTFQAAASWRAERPDTSLFHDLPPILTEGCGQRDEEHSSYLRPCTCSGTISALNQAGGYCIPINENHTPIARLYLRLSPRVKFTKEMSDMLENITDEIAIGLTTTRLRQKQAEMKIAESTAELRQIISHDLHDTIGQNLCYLRMRLDQFSQVKIQGELGMIQPELENMRDLANESYELIRGLLAAIDPEPSIRLEHLLEYHAKLVSDRTKINIKVINKGRPRNLHPSTVYHIYFIFREALKNVERHAKAQSVKVNILWSEEELHIKIIDNGKGFDPDFQPNLGHYGLTFMSERARSLGGRLDLLSSANEGTHLSLWLPLIA
jgi:signal transduction histidine kinase